MHAFPLHSAHSTVTDSRVIVLCAVQVRETDDMTTLKPGNALRLAFVYGCKRIASTHAAAAEQPSIHSAHDFSPLTLRALASYAPPHRSLSLRADTARKGCRANLFYNAAGHLVYHAAALGACQRIPNRQPLPLTST